MSEQPLSDELRDELIKIAAVGIFDQMAGTLVTDEDVTTPEVAHMVLEIARHLVDSSDKMIAQYFTENPESVRQAVYEAGRVAWANAEARKVSEN